MVMRLCGAVTGPDQANTPQTTLLLAIIYKKLFNKPLQRVITVDVTAECQMSSPEHHMEASLERRIIIFRLFRAKHKHITAAVK